MHAFHYVSCKQIHWFDVGSVRAPIWGCHLWQDPGYLVTHYLVVVFFWQFVSSWMPWKRIGCIGYIKKTSFFRILTRRRQNPVETSHFSGFWPAGGRTRLKHIIFQDSDPPEAAPGWSTWLWSSKLPIYEIYMTNYKNNKFSKSCVPGPQ